MSGKIDGASGPVLPIGSNQSIVSISKGVPSKGLETGALPNQSGAVRATSLDQLFPPNLAFEILSLLRPKVNSKTLFNRSNFKTMTQKMAKKLSSEKGKSQARDKAADLFNEIADNDDLILGYISSNLQS